MRLHGRGQDLAELHAAVPGQVPRLNNLIVTGRASPLAVARRVVEPRIANGARELDPVRLAELLHVERGHDLVARRAERAETRGVDRAQPRQLCGRPARPLERL